MTFALPAQFSHGRDMHGQSKHGKCTLQLTALKKCNKKYAITAFKVQETLLEIQKFNCQLLWLFAAENDGNVILDLEIIEIFLGEQDAGHLL